MSSLLAPISGQILKYAVDQDHLLLHMQKIVALNEKSRSYRCERLNNLCPNSHIYHIGDLVLSCFSVKFNKTKGVVDKTNFSFNGPWTVTKKLKGVLYDLTHTTPKKVTTKHAMHTSLFTHAIQVVAPLDGVDSLYGQLYSPFNHSAYGPFKS